MRKFQVLRYLKTLRYFILVVALLGSGVVYWYATSHQQYTAEAVIEYTNPTAIEGTTPLGEKIDSSEIYSAAVITDVINDFGLKVHVDTIRSACKVTEIIPEDEQTKKDALLEDGEDYTYHPTTFKVTYTVGNEYSKDYARNILDSILSNYFSFYSEKYIDQSTVPNNVSNVSLEKYDYLDCVEILDKATAEIETYLSTKSEANPAFRSSKTGYSFGDLEDYYHYISKTTIPSYYAVVLDGMLTQDKDALLKRYENKISNYDIEIASLNEHITELRNLFQQYGDKITKSESNVAGAIGDNTDAIIEDVELWKSNEDVNVDTTYDDLIDYYVQLQSQKNTAEIERQYAQKYMDLFANATVINDAPKAVINQLASDIEDTVAELNDLYDILVTTADEYSEYSGANNLATLTSTYVKESINVNMYLMLAIVLFLIIGCIGAVVLGRLGDFVEYFLYTDRKTDLPNRSKCDAVIDSYGETLLNDHFSTIAIRLQILSDVNQKAGRRKGDEILKDFGKILGSLSKDYGFTGYNNGELFLSFFENCSMARAEGFLEHLQTETDAYNNRHGADTIRYVVGLAESTSDNTYGIRELMRLAISRLNTPSKG